MTYTQSQDGGTHILHFKACTDNDKSAGKSSADTERLREQTSLSNLPRWANVHVNGASNGELKMIMKKIHTSKRTKRIEQNT